MSSEREEINEYAKTLYQGEIKSIDSLDKSLLQISTASVAGISAVYTIDSLKPVVLCHKVLLLVALFSALSCVALVVWSFWQSAELHSKLRALYEDNNTHTFSKVRSEAESIHKKNGLRYLNKLALLSLLCCLAMFSVYVGIKILS